MEETGRHLALDVAQRVFRARQRRPVRARLLAQPPHLPLEPRLFTRDENKDQFTQQA